jgi:hypothetical protein
VAAFITATELSSFLGRDVTTDDGVDLAIDGACATCETVADQTFGETNETVTLDGSGTDAMVLPGVPVSRVSSVTVAGTATTEFVADTRRGMLVKQSGLWPRGRMNVVVRYTHGYRSTDVPDDVRMVALNLAGRLLVQGPKNAMAETNGDVQIRYAVAATDLTANELRILRRHSGR